MYELFWWFWVAYSYTVKLLKPWDATLASLGVSNHDTIPYFKMKGNFVHILFWGSPLFWGFCYQTIFSQVVYIYVHLSQNVICVDLFSYILLKLPPAKFSIYFLY